MKYLGVHLVSGRDIKFDLMPVKRAFYSSCNSIFMHSNNLNELAVLSLQESYSLSVLMYSIPAMSLSAKQISELGVCWNSVIRKLFNYNKWESVKGVLHGLGRLNISHLIMLRKVKFYKHLFLSANSVLHNVFNFVLVHNYSGDDMLRTVFMPLCLAVDLVYHLFDDYVGFGM